MLRDAGLQACEHSAGQRARRQSSPRRGAWVGANLLFSGRVGGTDVGYSADSLPVRPSHVSVCTVSVSPHAFHLSCVQVLNFVPKGLRLASSLGQGAVPHANRTLKD